MLEFSTYLNRRVFVMRSSVEKVLFIFIFCQDKGIKKQYKGNKEGKQKQINKQKVKKKKKKKAI